MAKRCLKRQRSGLDLTPAVMTEAAKILNQEDEEALYVSVGEGSITEDAVLEAGFPGFERDTDDDKLPMVHDDWEQAGDGTGPISGIADAAIIHMANCCHPVRGDRIVGIKIVGKGIDIHTIDCPKLAEFDDSPDLWLDLGWRPSMLDDNYYTGRLHLDVVNERGALASIASVVSKSGGNISNLFIEDRDPEFVVMVIDVDVRDVKHLNDVCRALRVSRVISRVDRQAE